MTTMREILQDYGVSFVQEGEHHHAREGWIQMDCPFCNPNSENYRLGYNEAYGYFNCWACGPHYKTDVLVELTRQPWSVCKALLEGVERISIPERERPKGKLLLPMGLMQTGLASAHVQYLLKRGFNIRELANVWRVRGITHSDKYPWRLFIPLYFRGEVVSFTTRSLKDQGRRYLAASSLEESINHRDLLYGEDYCQNSIIVCEGPTDVWRIGPGAVATFGTGFSKKQFLKIVKYPVRYICFDRETFAQERAKRLCEQLQPFPGTTTNIKLESGKDPGSASVEEIESIRVLALGRL